MCACQILWLCVRGLIYDLAILSTAYSVKMVVVGMNGQCSPYLVPSNFNTLRYVTQACCVPIKL